jgi:hypothetical protein
LHTVVVQVVVVVVVAILVVALVVVVAILVVAVVVVVVVVVVVAVAVAVVVVVKMIVMVVVEVVVVVMVVTGCGGCRGKEVCARAGPDDDAHFWSVVENPVRVGVLYELELTQSRVHVLLLLVSAQQHSSTCRRRASGGGDGETAATPTFVVGNTGRACVTHPCSNSYTTTTNAHTTTEFDMVKSDGDKREKRHAGLACNKL